MTPLEKIKAPVAAQMTRYEEYLRETLQSEIHLTQEMLDFILSTRGKAIRPLMVILCASICNSDACSDGNNIAGGSSGSEKNSSSGSSAMAELPRDTYTAAMLLEMIHTASLIHDDVIDEAPIRRGKPSVNALWKSKRAVLVGDFILARSYSVGMRSGAYRIVEYISDCMPLLCEGELLQSEQSDLLQMTRSLYNDIIYRKTATLIGTSCGVGAMSVGADDARIAAMKELGDAIGMAFQIKDDILDYQPTSLTGKPLCGDLHEQKITLPLLVVLENSSDSERQHILGLLSRVRENPENAERLHDIVLSRGGLAIASEVADSYVTHAITLLESFPASQYRNALADLFLYVASRES